MKGRRVDEYGVGRPGVSESSVGRSRWFKFFDRSQGLFASRIAGWAIVMSRGVTGIIIIREEKIRSGQAGLLVPKATTTARVSLPPFATCEGGKMYFA